MEHIVNFRYGFVNFYVIFCHIGVKTDDKKKCPRAAFQSARGQGHILALNFQIRATPVLLAAAATASATARCADLS